MPCSSASRRASAAVFSHSQPSTARVSREDRAKPMEKARAMTQRKLRTANLAPEANFIGVAQVAVGNSTVNAAPPSGRLVARSVPWCCSTMA